MRRIIARSPRSSTGSPRRRDRQRQRAPRERHAEAAKDREGRVGRGARHLAVVQEGRGLVGEADHGGNPPRTPVTKKTRASGPSQPWLKPPKTKSAMRKEPERFTSTVPHGKSARVSHTPAK